MELHTDDKIISRQSNRVFDEHVAPEFDKHVRKSVPNCVHVQDLAETFSDWFTYLDSTVIDFGASTGETLRRIKRRHSKTLNLIGYDNYQIFLYSTQWDTKNNITVISEKPKLSNYKFIIISENPKGIFIKKYMI